MIDGRVNVHDEFVADLLEELRAADKTASDAIGSFVELRAAAYEHHEHHCGCAGDACNLGQLLANTYYLDPVDLPIAA
jgi:hypothetical protein